MKYRHMLQLVLKLNLEMLHHTFTLQSVGYWDQDGHLLCAIVRRWDGGPIASHKKKTSLRGG